MYRGCSLLFVLCGVSTDLLFLGCPLNVFGSWHMLDMHILLGGFWFFFAHLLVFGTVFFGNCYFFLCVHLIFVNGILQQKFTGSLSILLWALQLHVAHLLGFNYWALVDFSLECDNVPIMLEKNVGTLFLLNFTYYVNSSVGTLYQYVGFYYVNSSLIFVYCCYVKECMGLVALVLDVW